MSGIQILITKLLAAPAIIDFVGDRVFPGDAPQEQAKPYIVVGMVGERDEEMLDGAGDYPETRVPVECCAETAAEAVAMGEAAKSALRAGIKETIGAAVDVDFRKADSDVLGYSDHRSAYVRTLDFYVRFRSLAGESG